MTDEEVLSPRPMRRPARRLRPPPDDLPTPPIRGSVLDIRARLDRLNGMNRPGRFSQPVDLKLLAVAWASDYVSQVFPDVRGAQSTQLLLASEAGFLAAIEMGKTGIHQWQRLLHTARSAKEDFTTE